jgi:hypothetical protein
LGVNRVGSSQFNWMAKADLAYWRKKIGYRTVLGVPLSREGHLIGAILPSTSLRLTLQKPRPGYRHWYGPNLPYLGTYNRPNTEHLESCQADRTYLVRRRRGC